MLLWLWDRIDVYSNNSLTCSQLRNVFLKPNLQQNDKCGLFFFRRGNKIGKSLHHLVQKKIFGKLIFVIFWNLFKIGIPSLFEGVTVLQTTTVTHRYQFMGLWSPDFVNLILFSAIDIPFSSSRIVKPKTTILCRLLFKYNVA